MAPKTLVPAKVRQFQLLCALPAIHSLTFKLSLACIGHFRLSGLEDSVQCCSKTDIL